MSESVQIVFISFFLSIATAVVGYIINRRATFAKAGADSGDAAESLSNAAKIQIELYQKEIVTPMRDRIEQLTEQLSVVEEDRYQEQAKLKSEIGVLQKQIAQLTNQIEFMKGELRRADTSLEYAVSVARATHSAEMDRAVRIRRGQE